MQPETENPRDHFDVSRRRAELPFGMESRDAAKNYFAWQAHVFRKIATGRIIDHGAGTGGLSSALYAAGARDIVALEPDADLVAVLRRKFEGHLGLQVFPGTLDGYLASFGPGGVDCIVSSNVIEHIQDDVSCLRAMWDALRPGGSVGIYVPARPELYGSLDETVGHVRRYTRETLRDKLRQARFDIRLVEYRNIAGVLPWLITGRVLKRTSIGTGSISFFDRVVFPICSRLEDAMAPPYGLNLVAIGTKPDAAATADRPQRG